MNILALGVVTLDIPDAMPTPGSNLSKLPRSPCLDNLRIEDVPSPKPPSIENDVLDALNTVQRQLDEWAWVYSYRKATMGSIFIARRAGT